MTQIPLLASKNYRVRHIAPGAGEGATQTILGKTYGFTELPLFHHPIGADLVEGSYTLRTNDSGEFTLTFPNTAGPKGLWREQFSEEGSAEFIEIYCDDVLEFVGVILDVDINEQKVTISGPDAWGLLRRAYERDRYWVASPNEMIDYYSRVPLMAIAEDFRYDDGSAWTATTAGTGASVSIVNNMLKLKTATGGAGEAKIAWPSFLHTEHDWRLSTRIDRLNYDTHTTASMDASTITFGVTATSTDVGGAGTVTLAAVEIYLGHTGVSGGGYVLPRMRTYTPEGVEQTLDGVRFPTPTLPLPLSLTLVRQGLWLKAYVNNNLIGYLTVDLDYDNIKPFVKVNGSLAMATSWEVSLGEVNCEIQTPFLSRDTDKGDLSLPSDAPVGGLKARFWNDGDLSGLGSGRWAIVQNPNRASYADRLEDTLTSMTLPMQPGADTKYWSARWTGAIYLRPSLGNYTIELQNVVGGCRLWIGSQKKLGYIIDGWSDPGITTTWSSSLLASELDEDGWYPIVVELHCGATNGALVMNFTPPATYTDPGGTTVTGGIKTAVPFSSLSPIGIFENRVQGQSHFDIIQQVLSQYGYQMTLEPQQLESGLFPGKLVPKQRIGRDTDVVLEAYNEAGDLLLSPGVTRNSSEQTYQLIGSGSGGNDQQLQYQLLDTQGVQNGLFSFQTWLDAGDIPYTDLLQARLNAELALRNSPWEEVRGNPLAIDRLADSWPLSGTAAAMRWEPGDGVRFLLPEIGVADETPRQITQVSRSFSPEGRTSTQVSFRQRPRNATRSIAQSLRRAMSYNRSNQGRLLTLAGEPITTTGNANNWIGGDVLLPWLPGDELVSAKLRVLFNDCTSMYMYIFVAQLEQADVTSQLGGPWTGMPFEIDFTPVVKSKYTADPRFFFRLYNNTGVTVTTHFSYLLEVYRR